ncbi:TetR family transcriptional regulator [Acuticoccus sediminis]|uniref:TetR family transcriptional regulator n=1 Tax=Acuticoccus sediminis TaxID=2184697 RepID=A0A8B2NKN9_9HYPH|nr:TetR/AcrR family transcriptional regulator [Acuticoccus sediminis]RAH96796.1 TetR family transcriptional regulator [Acuticoccus sediminis]
MANVSSTADEILACARTLVMAGGYNGFSYADIAKVVGVRKPSIHHHFPSKVDLVRELVASHRHSVEDGIARLERSVSDPVEQLRAYTRVWVTCIEDASVPICLCALLASEIPVLPEEVVYEVRAHFRALSAWLTSVMERGARDGRLNLSASPRVEGESFMATVHGAMLSARAYGDPKMFESIVGPLLERLTSRSG